MIKAKNFTSRTKMNPKILEKKNRKAFIPKPIPNNIQVPGMTLKRNAGLPTINNKSSNKKRAIIFVDANNWYHNIKNIFRPSEISINKISNLICNNLKFNLIEIRWYASIPDIQDGEKIYYEHMRFLSELKKEGIKIITRKLQRLSSKEMLKEKRKNIDSLDLCQNCKPLIEASFLDLTGINRKEKGVDVWIAVDMVRKSIVEKECDVCVLISGDTDFVPAVKLIKKAGKHILSAFVPFGYSTELRNSTEYFIIRKETLIKCFKDYENKRKK